VIKNRPTSHLELEHYQSLPKPPYRVALEKIPDLIKLMVLTLRHVEPLASDVLSAIDPIVDDFPHDDEKNFYRQLDPEFQLVFLVVNSLYGGDNENFRSLYPYSLSLIPSTKRGMINHSKFGSVDAFSGGVLNDEYAYLNLDPFEGSWEAFSQLSLISEMGAKCAFTDKLGIVYDYYFLRTGVNRHEVAQPSIGIDGSRSKRFMRHRAKLLYEPFKGVSARKIWGVENGLELFVLQEIIRQQLPWPTIQAHIYDDPAVYPCLYNAWSERETMNDAHFVAEVDFCYEERKLAVFCDGATHNRAQVKKRDAAINQKLEALGFEVVRIRSKDILDDVEAAVAPLTERLT